MKEERSLPFSALPDEDMKWESVLIRLVSIPHTRKELARKLRERRCPEEKAAELLDRFEEIGMIDDRAYALLYVDSKRDFGLRRLRDELRARGVSHADIDDALAESGIDEAERALRLARQWGNQRGMTPQKLDARLRRRGFSSSAVREAFSQLHEELENFRSLGEGTGGDEE
ncbi:MAG: regulatory protein RecX [Pyramidobacter sp.]|uniref:regulatory protein RecX n=1 Tax=Pyramidobacter sp. TaxID=1943581 RepID=UPI002A81EE20|nr:regulatory protein RecX [Pyramidobacter sp.]MDY4032857.1 regulatory protein RecX [Pyramidobacter sp.]